MSRYTKFVKADLVEFLEQRDDEIRATREKLWESQREVAELEQADAETLETARGKVLDVLQPLAIENSEALEYFWRRLELERNFGGITAEAFALVKDLWEQSEADDAATKLESMSA